MLKPIERKKLWGGDGGGGGGSGVGTLSKSVGQIGKLTKKIVQF